MQQIDGGRWGGEEHSCVCPGGRGLAEMAKQKEQGGRRPIVPVAINLQSRPGAIGIGTLTHLLESYGSALHRHSYNNT